MNFRDSTSVRQYYSNPTYTYRPGQLPTPVVLSGGDGGALQSLSLSARGGSLGTLGQEAAPSSDSGLGKIVFGIMLLGMGLSLGFALGVNQGVKVSKE